MYRHFQLAQDDARPNAQSVMCALQDLRVRVCGLRNGHSKEFNEMTVRRVCKSHGTDAYGCLASALDWCASPEDRRW